jgi:hypothetical protein
VDLGALILTVSWAVGLATAFLLRTRAPAVVVLILLGSAGIGLAWGGMLLQPAPSAGEFAFAVVALGVLVPAHVRIVLGPFGPR